jgi:two-component system, NarL family, sensor histidine kinase DesK
MSSQQLTAGKRIPWGALIWTLPLAYVFWAPYQRHAPWPEWLLTALVLLAMLALFLAGLTHGEDRRAATRSCAAMLCIAVCFLAYRPSGGLYFPVMACFVPAAVGRLGLSMTITAGVAALFGAEWGLLYADGSQGVILPLFVTVQIFISGIGTAFFVAQARAIQRRDKASERERIARDLHDVVGHSLSSLALKAELARRLFHADPERALKEIAAVEDIARQGLEELREAIHGYFAGDIQAELDRVVPLLKAAHIAVERRCEPLAMPPATERVLALILREAVTNIVRHSQARACRLALFRAGDACRLEISDNGVGGSHEEGVGMRSIRSRAEALGGTALWSSSSGTRLCVSLPIDITEQA